MYQFSGSSYCWWDVYGEAGKASESKAGDCCWDTWETVGTHVRRRKTSCRGKFAAVSILAKYTLNGHWGVSKCAHMNICDFLVLHVL